MAKTPLHLAIIPDGNRRWAKKRSLFPWKGHEKAGENFHDLVEWCRKSERISVLTFWCFSTENWKRDKREIDELMRLLGKYLQKERVSLQENHIHLIRSGRSDRVPKHLLDLIDTIEEETSAAPKMTLQLALDYGGKDEIIRAVQQLKNTAKATEEDIRAHLDHPLLPDIDLIIRTSGEQRTSNFFLWQSAYAEWMFVDTLFPDFSPKDLEKSLDDFEGRKRRFGA